MPFSPMMLGKAGVFAAALAVSAAPLAVSASAAVARAAPKKAVARKAVPAKAPAAKPAPVAPQVKVEAIKAGTGGKVPAHAYVLVNYKGMLKDGTVFDQAQQSALALDEVVPGFAQGLLQMERGGTYRMTIPPELGYGAQASGPIPANSTLVFEIDVLDFKTADEIAAMREQMMQQQAPQGSADPGQGAQPPQ